jgi:hypothetical protein
MKFFLTACAKEVITWGGLLFSTSLAQMGWHFQLSAHLYAWSCLSESTTGSWTTWTSCCDHSASWRRWRLTSVYLSVAHKFSCMYINCTQCKWSMQIILIYWVTWNTLKLFIFKGLSKQWVELRLVLTGHVSFQNVLPRGVRISKTR